MEKKECKERLGELRIDIDKIDNTILELLNKRAKIAKSVGEVKRECNLPVFNPKREEEIFNRLQELNKEFGEEFPTDAIKHVFKEIISACRSLEMDIKVAYLGPPATFTHQAAIKYFGQSVSFIPVSTIKDVFDEIERGNAKYGVVPIENSIEGVVNHTLEMLTNTHLKIIGEVIVEINLHLIGQNTNLKDIKKIYSHKHALGESREWIQKNMPHVITEEVESTSRAAELVREDYEAAAIASEAAAELYGLKIIARKIDRFPFNQTRFLIIGKEDENLKQLDESKTTFIFSVKNEVGALYKALGILYKYGINMSKIESRPSKQGAWDYIFFVDIEGHIEDENIKKALNELRNNTPFFKILGSYPKFKSNE